MKYAQMNRVDEIWTLLFLRGVVLKSVCIAVCTTGCTTGCKNVYALYNRFYSLCSFTRGLNAHFLAFSERSHIGYYNTLGYDAQSSSIESIRRVTFRLQRRLAARVSVIFYNRQFLIGTTR